MWKNRRVVPLLLALATPPQTHAALPSPPEIAEALRQERERLASYRWRLTTEMKVDDLLRVQRVDDVHLAPDGSWERKTVKYERVPDPTPVPYTDPRRDPRVSLEEDTRLFDQAQDVMQVYARLTPSRVAGWAAQAKLLPPDPDRPGLLRLSGRGLGRAQDDAVVYLDEKSRGPVEIEVKTTVSSEVVDLAFLRVTFETLPVVRTGVAPPVVPRHIFLNMNRGRRRVRLDMETSDYRSWS